MEFKDALAQIKKENGLDQQKIADLAGISKSYVNQLLSGTKKPSVKVVIDLAKALKLDEQQRNKLLELAGYKPESVNHLTLKDDALLIPRLSSPRKEAREAGVVSVYPSLSDTLLHARIMSAEKSVDIQDIWIPDVKQYCASFLELVAARPAVKIRILLSVPDEHFAVKREEQLHITSNSLVSLQGFISLQIKYAIQEFERLRIDKNVPLEIRLYKGIPGIQYIACDNAVFIGFYAHGDRSDLSPQLEISAKEGETQTTLGKFFTKEFEDAWKDTKQMQTLEQWFENEERKRLGKAQI